MTAQAHSSMTWTDRALEAAYEKLFRLCQDTERLNKSQEIVHTCEVIQWLHTRVLRNGKGQ